MSMVQQYHATRELYETPSNNHGCRGFSVLVAPITENVGVVLNGQSCSSCWQVGHDSDEPIIAVGTIVQLPAGCSSWDEANQPHGRSHNELISDSDEDPQSDTTAVMPSDLIKLGTLEPVAALSALLDKEPGVEKEKRQAVIGSVQGT